MLEPTLVPLPNVKHVGPGGAHCVALTSTLPFLLMLIILSCFLHRFSRVSEEDGGVWSWGWGEDGRLGHGDTRERLTPTRIHYFDDKDIISVHSGGGHSLALSGRNRSIPFHPPKIKRSPIRT